MPITTVLRKKAMARGLFEGSKAWVVVWVVLVGAKLLRKLDKPVVVFRQELEPGGAFLIRNGDRRVTIVGGSGVEVEG
ncbi:MAG TPA: hypothetical protein VMN58_05040 [Acidimicrobiales bacterium]|nr:hypothetical protein [Acidimicrobiales bacterium]